jgi:hypothetical protein
MAMPAPAAGVTVRMYQHGLGDCFLLAFRAHDGSPRYLLLDCGILLNSPGEKTRLETVLRHVLADTNRQDLTLAVSHEHWDHVSGFFHHQALFQNELPVGEVWLAWTEDPADAQARDLERESEQSFAAIRGALAKLEALGAAEQADRVEGVLGFLGVGPNAPKPALGFSKNTDVAMDLIRGRTPAPRYLQPGDTFTLPDVPDVRFYVLGPPRGGDLFSSNPRQGEAYEEEGLHLDGPGALRQALRVGADDNWGGHDDELWEQSKPFDQSLEVALEETKSNPWFREHYHAEDAAWRRIDTTWLDGAGELALQLDNHVNNTSLVFAIELGVGGRVLLFPGDAQAGSWRTWQNVEFTVDGRKVTGTDLLRRTSFYKVGHHGSHNATRRAELELMSDDLVAMIPVDRAIALKPKGSGGGWNFPWPPLEKRLLQRTRGRLIRADVALPPNPPTADIPGPLTQAEWDAFVAQIRKADTLLPTERESLERPLYVELTVMP